MPRPKSVELSLSGRHSGRLEQRSIDQHAVHDHRELASERHLRLLHAGAFGEPHRPALEGGAAEASARRSDNAKRGIDTRRPVTEAAITRGLKRPASARALMDAALTAEIRAAHAASKGTYGAPRLEIDLAEAGIRVSRKRVARLMLNAGLVGVSRRNSFGLRDDASSCLARDYRARLVQCEQPGKRIVFGNVPRPSVGSGHGCIEVAVRLDQPIWLLVVEGRKAFFARGGAQPQRLWRPACLEIPTEFQVHEFVGYVRVPWFSTATDSARHFW